MAKKTLLLFLALVYCFIFTVPNIIVKNYSATSSVSSFDYKVIDDSLYGAYYKDMQEGNFALTDPINYEHKNDKLPWAAIPFWIIGGIAYLIRSIDYSLILVVAVFSFLNFFIQYYFIKKLTNNAFISILGVFLIPLSHVFMSSPSRMIYFLFNYTSFDRFLWTSIPRRQVEIFFLFLPLLLFYLAYIHRSKILATISGLFVGLAAETYIYYFTFEIAGVFLLFLLSRYQKNVEDIKLVGTALISSLLFSLPYVIKTQAFKYDFAHALQYLSRLGLVESRAINTFYISLFFVLFLAVFFMYFSLIGKRERSFYFLNAFFIGNLILYNQHLITGLQLQTWHWLTITGRPWMLIMMLYLFNSYIQRKENKVLINFSISVLVMLVIAWSLWANIGVAQNLAKYYEVGEEYTGAFEWLNKNTPKDSVVLSPSFIISANIPLRTHNNVYLVNGFDSAARDCELLYRSMVSMKVLNVSSEKIFNADAKSLTSAESLPTYLFHMRHYPEIPETLRQKLTDLYRFIKVRPDDLFSYKLDYILLGKKEKELGLGQILISKQKVYSNGDLEIYKVVADESYIDTGLKELFCWPEKH